MVETMGGRTKRMRRCQSSWTRDEKAGLWGVARLATMSRHVRLTKHIKQILKEARPTPGGAPMVQTLVNLRRRFSSTAPLCRCDRQSAVNSSQKSIKVEAKRRKSTVLLLWPSALCRTVDVFRVCARARPDHRRNCRRIKKSIE